MLNRWQKTIVDQRGNVVPWAVLMIRYEANQMPATVYRDRDGIDPYPAGQVVADGNGFVFFYAPAGLYRITGQAPAIDWRDVGIGAPFDPDALGTAAAANVVTSNSDTTPGRVPNVGWMGLGSTTSLPAIGDMDAEKPTGFWRFTSLSTGTKPPGVNVGTVLRVCHSSGYSSELAFPSTLSDPRVFLRTIRNSVPSAWVEIYHSGNLPAPDNMQWLGTPIGGYITPLTPPPKDDPRFRYALCTAGQTGAGGYNNGILTGETVTGSAPLVNAIATVSLAGSPFDGLTTHLINTEKRFVGAGTAEAVEDDSFQNFAGHLSVYVSANAYADDNQDGPFYRTSGGPMPSAVGATNQYRIGFDPSRVARTSDHTQPSAHRLAHYRRIL